MCRRISLSKQPIVAPCSSTSNDNDNTISKDLAQHLALLVNVIHSQRWSAFQKIALANPRIFQMISDTIPTIDEFKGYKTLLHCCMHHNPPFEIVAKMIEMLPDSVQTLRVQDGKGRTPLHIAAACDANPMVIKLLGSADPTTCTILDDDSRTPLHLACDSSCNLFQARDDRGDGNDKLSHPCRKRDSPSYDAVRALLSDSLAASLVEDEDGMNALEYAILSNASLDVVALLQIATMQSQRERERLLRISKKRRRDDATSRQMLVKEGGVDATSGKICRRRVSSVLSD